MGTCGNLFGTPFEAWRSLDGVSIPNKLKEPLRLYTGHKHAKGDVVRYIVHVGSGGIRKTRRETLPATWAAVLTTVDAQGARAFSQYVCGAVSTNPEDDEYMGAESETNTTGETTAQAYAAALVMELDDGACTIPIDIVYGSNMAADIARSALETGKHAKLCAATGILWQILSMRRTVTWYHTYSHCGEELNELADRVVEHAARNESFRFSGSLPCNKWCQQYGTESIKLLCLLVLPRNLSKLYPGVSIDGESIASTPLAQVKWGIPASVIAANLDVLPERQGTNKTWVPPTVTFGTYNPGSLRGDGAETSAERQLGELDVGAMGMQETRDGKAFVKEIGDSSWVASLGMY